MPETAPAGEPARAAARTLGDAPDDLSDPELISATRDGDTTAYAVLYERHVHAARRLARILAADPASADDLVSETFAKLLHTLREGRGPDLAFRPYLLRTLRNTFYDRVRRDQRVEFTDDMNPYDPGQTFGDPAVEGQERRYASLAFGKLPERWRMVLWHTEVEEESPAQIAPMLGMTPNGVAALAYRARERLRQLYLQEHIADSPAEECRWTVDRLGARVRGTLAVRDVDKVDHHLTGCVSCNLLYAELSEVNSGMRGVLAPIVLGAAAAPYLAAGSAAAAGAALGGLAATLAAPFIAVADWCRRLFQRLGTRGSIATGTAAAVVAATAIIALTSGDPEPAPPAAAPDTGESEVVADPADPADPPAPEPEPDPDEPAPAPGEDPPADPEPDDPPPAPGEDPPGSAPRPDDPTDPPPGTEDPPTSYSIGHGLGAGGLVAGTESVLPVQLRAAESGGASIATAGAAPEGAAERAPERSPRRYSVPAAGAAVPQRSGSQVTLTVDVPDGVALASPDAGSGWRCETTGARIRCSGDAIPDSGRVEIRIAIDAGLSGYRGFTVTAAGRDVTGRADLRVPIAPADSKVGYASATASGVTAAGNTWITCKPPACHDAAMWGIGDRYAMRPYKAPKPDPQPPAGKEGDAVSGADVGLPPGATVEWAGLYWAASGSGLPTQVAMAGPDGTWSGLSAATVRAAGGGEQAFADVTSQVRSGGRYWVAVDNHKLPGCGNSGCGTGAWAGWSLTVVYSGAGGLREVAVYDGPVAADVAIDVGAGDVAVAHTVWGGSAYKTGDKVVVGGQDQGPAARCYAEGAANNPRWYTFGTDVDVHGAHVSGSSDVRIVRGKDRFIVGVVAVASPPGALHGKLK